MENTMPDINEQNGTAIAETEGMATLDQFMTAETTKTAQPEPSESTPVKKEPGYVQSRINRAVDKATKDIEARYNAQIEAIRAEYESKLAPMVEYQLAAQAEQMVASGQISNREMAIEYLRMKNNLPKETYYEQPHDEQGRYTSYDIPEETQQKASMLVDQAETVMRSTGIDVMDIYNNDPDAHEKILSGEWDFVDIAKHYSRPSTPSPVRSTNGAGYGSRNVQRMSKSDFDRMNEYLSGGGVIDMR